MDGKPQVYRLQWVMQNFSNAFIWLFKISTAYRYKHFKTKLTCFNFLKPSRGQLKFFHLLNFCIFFVLDILSLLLSLLYVRFSLVYHWTTNKQLLDFFFGATVLHGRIFVFLQLWSNSFPLVKSESQPLNHQEVITTWFLCQMTSEEWSSLVCFFIPFIVICTHLLECSNNIFYTELLFNGIIPKNKEELVLNSIDLKLLKFTPNNTKFWFYFCPQLPNAEVWECKDA